MQPRRTTDLPHRHGAPLGPARFKTFPEDFVVEELLGFEPSGEGEHALLWVEKRGIDSNDAARALAAALGIKARLVSHCGLKDRHAVTRQWFSAHLPGQASPKPGAIDAALAGSGVRILRITRNRRKLRRGAHLGNRFSIVLRGAEFPPAAARARWAEVVETGAPNYFGPQRFGARGDNVLKALALFRGEFSTRDRHLRGLLISAARAHLFNAVVAERLGRQLWETPLEGEVFGFADNRSLVLPDRHRGDEAERFSRGDLELTAPLWGAGAPLSTGACRELEHDVAARFPELCAGLEAAGLRQERRVTRLRPLASEPGGFGADGTITLRFDLPKGTYATTLLREFAELREPLRPPFTRVQSAAEIAVVAHLAETIWTEHYTPLIGAEQVRYMLRELQSEVAIAAAISGRGAEYYLLGSRDSLGGYLALEPEPGALLLSKIYVADGARTGGYGFAAYRFALDRARALALPRLRLTVNKGNAGAIAAYERWGMRRTRELVADIGGGFVMDDYEYAVDVPL